MKRHTQRKPVTSKKAMMAKERREMLATIQKLAKLVREYQLGPG